MKDGVFAPRSLVQLSKNMSGIVGDRLVLRPMHNAAHVIRLIRVSHELGGANQAMIPIEPMIIDNGNK